MLDYSLFSIVNDDRKEEERAWCTVIVHVISKSLTPSVNVLTAILKLNKLSLSQGSYPACPDRMPSLNHLCHHHLQVQKYIFGVSEIRRVCPDNDENPAEIVAGSKIGDFGWIESVGFPAFNNGSRISSWVLKIPAGFSAQIGFEKLEFVDKELVDLLQKRPRIDDDDVGEVDDYENIFDDFGTFREDRRLKHRPVDKNEASVILSDADVGSTLLVAPVSAVEGTSYVSKFESSISFRVDQNDRPVSGFRFRINFQVISP